MNKFYISIPNCHTGYEYKLKVSGLYSSLFYKVFTNFPKNWRWWGSRKKGTFWKLILFYLLQVSWYWGALTLEEAERLLEGRGEGCFLVRDSTSLTCVFSIAVKILPAKRPVHIRIEYVNGEFRLQCSQYSVRSNLFIQLVGKGGAAQSRKSL